MNWKILNNYIRGNCDEAELRELGKWLLKDPANEDFFVSFIEGLDDTGEIEFYSDARNAWNEFERASLDTENRVEEFSHMSRFLDSTTKNVYDFKKRRHGPAYWLYSAAALMAVIVALIFVVQQNSVFVNPIQGDEISYQEISTVKGQRSNLKLSDGTQVILNSSTMLRIPKNYGQGTRTIYMEGEAFFEVKHDEENPFIVISHETYTKDLGTQFNVNAYDSSNIEVAVKEGLVSMGKVKKGDPDQEMAKLTPNKLGVLKRIEGLTVSDIADLDQYIAWTEGKLAFRSTPFPEVINRLERWYDIECRVEVASTNLENRTLTATYDNLPMGEVLKVLSISLDISYNQKGRIVTFSDGNILKNTDQAISN